MVVGRGRVGGALTRAWRASGLKVRNVSHLQLATGRFAGSLLVLAVPDRAIETCAAHLASRTSLPAAVVHVAGALDRSSLSALEARGVATGVLHPLLAIPHPRTPLTGATARIEGPPGLRRRLASLARQSGMRPLARSPHAVDGYHLAAVLAANGLGPILEAATGEAVRAGLEEEAARQGLARLAHSAIDGWLGQGGPEGLTGPIARGDVATVERHLAWLRESPEATRVLHRALSLATLALAERRRAPPPGLDALRRRLGGRARR